MNFIFKSLLIALFFLPNYSYSAESSASQFLQDAQQAVSKGEFKTALIHLKNASVKYPDDIKIKLALADLFIQIGFGAEAQIELDKASYLGAKKKDTQLLRINAQLIQGKFRDVTSQIGQILHVKTEDIGRIRALQGQAYLNQGNIEKARSFFMRGSRLAPNALEVQIGLARLYTIDKKKKQAKKIIEKLYKEYPYNTNVLLLIGNLKREEGAYLEARDLFEKIISIQPGNTASRIGIITTYIDEDNYAKANEVVDNLLVVDAKHISGNYLKAIISYQLQDYTKAMQAIKVIEEQNRKHTGILLISGFIYYQQKEYDAAETQLKKYLAIKPKDLATIKMLSATYLKKKQGSQAIQLLEPYKDLKDSSILSMLSRAYKILGNQDKSTFYLEKALKIDPDNPNILTQKRLNIVLSDSNIKLKLIDQTFDNFTGIGYPKYLQFLKGNKIKEAVELIKSYQLKEPDNSLYYDLIGEAYLQANDLDAAQINFTKVLELNPNSLKSRVNLAHIAIAKNDLALAKREYQRILSRDPKNEIAMMDLAKLSLKEKKISEMLSWLTKARISNRSSVESRVALNNFYANNNDLRNALKISYELVDIQPDNVSILKLHADNLLKAKKLSSAIRTYKRIVELKPNDAYAYYWLASTQYLWNDTDSARKNFAKVLELKPNHVISRNAIIKIDLKLKNYKKSLSDALALVKIDPKISLSHETLGDVYVLMKKPKKAIKAYSKSLSLKDNNYLLVNKIARTYARMGNKKKAAQTFENWLKKYPKNTKIRNMLALLYQQTGQFKKAKSHYELIIEQLPDSALVINNLALVYDHLDDPRAIEYAEIAYSLAPKNANVLDTLGWLLLHNEEHSRALSILKKAIDINPSDFDLRYHYAVALSKNDQIKEAKKQLNMVVPVKGKFKSRKDAKKLLEKLSN